MKTIRVYRRYLTLLLYKIISKISNFDDIYSRRTLKPLKPYERIILYVLSIFTAISATLYFSAKLTEKLFGSISLTQIIFNIRTKGGEGAALDIFLEYKYFVILFIIQVSIVLYILWIVSTKLAKGYGLLEQIESLLRFIYKVTFSVISHKRLCNTLFLVMGLLAINYYFLHAVDRKFNVIDFLKQSDSPFIKTHYAKLNLDSNGVPQQKRNLIVIFLESIEFDFADSRVFGENLIPELDRLAQEGLTLRGYRKTTGGYFTLDGISAQTIGMPITQLPVDIHDMRNNNQFGSFLAQSPGVFNFLQHQGYITASFSGTSKDFTHKGAFLQHHGISQTFFKENWLEQGFTLDERHSGRWDFNDTFLMERLKNWLSQPKDQPFAVLFETVDTHFPIGFAPEEFRKEGNHQDAVRYSSHLIGEFIAWAKKQPWYDNTTIYIAGDHQWQDFQNDFTKLTQKATNRGIYSVLLQPARTDLHIKPCGFSAMDIAPTLLNALGFEFKSKIGERLSQSRLGLGVSLFSDEPNLVCQFGPATLSRNLEAYSSFYNTLH